MMAVIQFLTYKTIILSIFLKNDKSVDNPSIRIYVNKIENRITFKIKNGYYLELLMPETMKLLGTTESKITKDKNGENVPNLEIVELVLVHCNNGYQHVELVLVHCNNGYQQDSRILSTLVPNTLFGSLLEISPTNHIFLKTFNSEFQENKRWFTDQTNSNNSIVWIKCNFHCIKMPYSTEPRKRAIQKTKEQFKKQLNQRGI